MKPKLLKFAGIIPFTNPVEIDFSKLDKLAAITGPNGAGKSTILETIFAALFNTWPSRTMGKDAGTIYDVIVPYMKAYIEMIFEAKGITYRVIRNYTYGVTWTGKMQKKADGNQMAFIYQWIGLNVDAANAPDGWLPKAQQPQNVDAFIQENIFTREFFLASAFNSQESVGDIIDAPVSERKQMFANILNLQHLQRKSDLFSERVKFVESMIDTERTNIKIHESAIVDKQIVNDQIDAGEQEKMRIESLLVELNNHRDLIIESAATVVRDKDTILEKNLKMNVLLNKRNNLERDQKERQSFLAIEKSLLERQTQIVDLKAQVETQDALLVGKDEVQKQIEPLRLQINELNEKRRQGLDARRDRIDAKNAELRSAESLYREWQKYHEDYLRQKDIAAKLNGLECPKNCVYVSDAVGSERYILHVNYQELINEGAEKEGKVLSLRVEISNIINDPQIGIDEKAFTLQVKTIQDKIVYFQNKINEYGQIESHIRTLQSRISAIEAGGITEKLALMPEHRKRIAELDKEIEEVTKAIYELMAELDELNKRESVAADYDEAIRLNKEKIDELHESKNNLIAQVANLRDKLSRSSVATLKRNMVQSRINKLSGLQASYSRLSEAFGLKGMQALIIDAEKSQFLSIAKELFDVLSGGEMALQFETTKITKAGDIKEDFGLFLIIKGKRVEIKFCSKGQKDLGRMVMRATLGIYNGFKNPGIIETLFLDETTGSFDEVKRENYFEFLKYLTRYFLRILVISHQDIAQIIPGRIRITDDQRLEID